MESKVKELARQAIWLIVPISALIIATKATWGQIDAAPLPTRIYDPPLVHVSPYLRLLDEEAIDLPAYSLYLRPQFDDEEVNKRQRDRIRQLDVELNELDRYPLGPQVGRYPLDQPFRAHYRALEPTVWPDPRPFTMALPFTTPPQLPAFPSGAGGLPPQRQPSTWMGTYPYRIDGSIPLQIPQPAPRFMNHSGFLPPILDPMPVPNGFGN